MSTNTEAEPNINQAESDFVDAYERSSVDNTEINNHFAKIIEILKTKSTPPPNDLVINYEIQTKADFTTKGIDIFPKSCFVATVYIGRFLNDLSLVLDNLNNKEFDAKEYAEFEKYMKEEPESEGEIVKYSITLKAAIALFLKNEEYVEKYYTADLLDFLGNTLLVQNVLCQSRIFHIVLEAYAKIFVKRALDAAKNQIHHFNEQKVSQRLSNKDEQPYHNILVFLKFVTTIGNFWPGPDYAAFFYENGTEYIHDSRDSITPPLFCGIVDCHAMICRTKELIRKDISSIASNSSDIINFLNFIKSIHGHALDLGSCDIERKALSDFDAEGMESVLKYLAAVARVDPSHFKVDIYNNNNQDANEQQSALSNAIKQEGKSVASSLIQIILSSVPATLKGCCFELLAAMPSEYNTEIWAQLSASKILTSDIIKSGKGGILTEINDVENKAGIHPITRNFIKCLASLLKNGAPNEGFELYHTFLFKIVLVNHSNWTYNNASEKWGLLSDIAQCWTNLLLYQEKHCQCLMESFVCDQELLKHIIYSINDDDCPLETLYTCYRLFLIVAEKHSYMKSELSSLTFTTVEEQLGWNTTTINKILRCTACIDSDLQRVAIHLLQKICLKSPDVAQVIISKPISRAIDVIKYVIEYDEPEDEDDDVLNIRCSMLTFLLSLGSESYFLRHVTGFSLHDPPLSIIQSSLTEGILPTILEKLHNHDTHMSSPKFTSLSLRLILLLTDSNLTIGPTLNLLLSSKHNFFVDQLVILRDKRCQLSTVGCYLQLLARASSLNNEAIFSGATQTAFNNLLTTNSGNLNSNRIILLLEFIDRIKRGEDSLLIANGVKEIVVNFFANEHAVKMMKQTSSTWSLSWLMFVTACLEDIPKLDINSSELLVSAAASISNKIFGERVFENIDEESIRKVFKLSLTTLIYLVDNRNAPSRAGIYSIIDSILKSLKNQSSKEPSQNDEKNSQLLTKYQEDFAPFENDFIDTLEKDLRNEIPIVEAGAISVAESLIPICSPASLLPLIKSSLYELEDDWQLFNEDDKSGTFVIKSKCSFYTRYISLTENKYLLRVFIEEGLVKKLSFEDYWRNPASIFSTCTTSSSSEAKLIMGSSILKLFSTLMSAFEKNQDVKRHITHFLTVYKDAICAVLNFGGVVTLIALEFLADIIRLVSVVPGLERAVKNPIIERIPNVFMKFANFDSWKSDLRENSETTIILDENVVPQEYEDKAKKVVQKLLNNCITFLVRRTEATMVFTPPLNGDEWLSKKNNRDVPLSVVTYFCKQILEGTPEPYAKTISSMCLVIIYRHLLVWSGEGVDFDVSTVRSQAKIFSENPFPDAQSKGYVDGNILKKIIAFHSTNGKM
ncbi:hypothetical protein TVAG_011300 [Trichomonas vaginalis G3]|uniref:Uncharacterized protein n=1 Tax=Trichomonas vaginalis (strain ATCC PRA-98 / G3) TaxID=412133 RepID=A2FDN7_TRIV3|nr:nuclear pore organization [Trichomonas vaginalis G3]EAX96981.1 hypothetical protein TVAG_011300 [Trichomonas vaginalis G3]KAI5524906.1 nuclear pore organization [Trichomonas vaginalis G3]|eukprot:XP_001309911.1 hypothetical protein [Trichomonas vaginalis G3]